MWDVSDIEWQSFLSPVNAEVVLKGTNVDGVYDCHSRDNNATFEHISFRELGSRGAIAMDAMALSFCEENGIPGGYFALWLFDVLLALPSWYRHN